MHPTLFSDIFQSPFRVCLDGTTYQIVRLFKFLKYHHIHNLFFELLGRIRLLTKNCIFWYQRNCWGIELKILNVQIYITLFKLQIFYNIINNKENIKRVHISNYNWSMNICSKHIHVIVKLSPFSVLILIIIGERDS